MNSKIIPLSAENYRKCSNIWNMDKHHELARRCYEELLSGNRRIFVYTEQDEYIGEGALVFDDNGDPDYTILGKRIYFSRMVVKKEYRNKGIGTEILAFLVDYARELGYSEMSVGVDIDNIGARWLYEKNGFTKIIFVGEDDGGKYVKLLKKL